MVLQSPADTLEIHLQPLPSGWASCSTDSIKGMMKNIPAPLSCC